VGYFTSVGVLMYPSKLAGESWSLPRKVCKPIRVACSARASGVRPVEAIVNYASMHIHMRDMHIDMYLQLAIGVRDQLSRLGPLIYQD
jgi:hypothetical protein